MDRDTWINYYKVLGVTGEASAKEITSAYRVQALKCHPDKNIDDPQASARFHQLTRAYQVLIDEEARRAFDAVLAGRQAFREREQQLDNHRRTMRDDLLRREREARRRKAEQTEAERRLAQEIDRVRREAAAARSRATDKNDEDVLDDAALRKRYHQMRAAAATAAEAEAETSATDREKEETEANLGFIAKRRPLNYESDVLARMRQRGRREAEASSSAGDRS